MRIVFGGWKYIARNLWYVLPLMLIPAVFCALSVDYAALAAMVRGFFTGDPRVGFLECFFAWSFLRFDSWQGALVSVFAVVCLAVLSSLLLVLVEKHMRLGRRTLSGAAVQMRSVLLPTVAVAFLYLILYEVWAVVLSAMLFAVSALRVTALVYVLEVLVLLLSGFALLYLATVFYLFLPCKQITGFDTYHAFLYSYRLMTGVRGRLLLSFLISFAADVVLLTGASFLPRAVFYVIAAVLYLFMSSSFLVRMLTVYYETDKLDREDLLHSYREL